MKNGSSDDLLNTESYRLTTPPCQDIEKESTKVRNCCNMFSKAYRNANTKQIMALMKYSLDIANPWISQYQAKPKDIQYGNNRYMSRQISKAWFAKNNEELLKLFSRTQDMNFLNSFG